MPRLPRLHSRVLALLLVLVLFRYFRLPLGFAIFLADGFRSMSYGIVVGGFLALMAATITGLYQRRIWGVYCVYALVPVSTVLLSIPFIPFVTDLLPTLQMRIIALPIINSAFLVGVMALHLRYRRAIRDGAYVQPEAA